MRNLCQIILTFFFLASTANAWSLFGPQNYDQCVREGLTDLATKLQLRTLIASCSSEFSHRKEDMGQFDDELEGCGINLSINSYLPIENPKTREIINKLTAVKIQKKSRLLYLSFQNRNDFSIAELRVGFCNYESCVSGYDAAIDFVEVSGGVKSGSYGTLVNIDNAALIEEYKNYSILTVKHESVTRNYADKEKLLSFLSSNGFCE